MKELIIVPTFERSEMLYVTLEAIRAADPELPIHVFPDRGSDENEVCARHGAIAHKTIAHTYHGNSFVMLESLKWAYKQKADIVYVIEDDAVVYPDFFEWCRSSLKAHPDIFAACGWRYSPDALPPCFGPDIIIPWYLSVATALPKKSLYGIIQHACPEYYSDMKSYLDRAYPASNRRGSMHYEQDGLTLRVCESESKRCAWPRRPRATHIGWRGYHMPSGAALGGTLDERVAIAKLLLRNPQMLQALLSGGSAPEISYCRECEKPVLSSEKIATIVCAKCFHAAHPDLPQTAVSHYYLKSERLSSEI